MRLLSRFCSAETPAVLSTLVLDLRVVDWGFHDVTIVDMEDVSAPDISDADLSLLR